MPHLGGCARRGLCKTHPSLGPLSKSHRCIVKEWCLGTSFGLQLTVVVPTPFGNLIVGTESDDVYTGSACYIIDPAGNDVYGGSMGVANGFVGQPISVIYDFSGQDVYAGRSGLLGSGSAIFGISLIKDFDGDDCYVSEGAGQAAAMCGVAMLDDLGGDDVYAGESFCQAAAFAGIARLRDYQGTDDYCVGQAGQGYAGVMAIGMLFDAEGDDLYRAGFAARDTERHDERYQSLAQGFFHRPASISGWRYRGVVGWGWG